MAFSGINLENVKLINRSSILMLLNAHGSLSRKDIATSLGLTPAAVTQICSELIEKKIIKEIGELSEESRVGRKKILLEINYEYSKVIAITIEETETYIALCKLNGKCIDSCVIVTDINVSPKDFCEKIADSVCFLMKKNKLKKEDFLGLGVSIPGIVQKESGKSLHAYRIWDKEVDLKELLIPLTKLPVVVENNVKAFTQAELMFGSGRTQDKLLFIKWGPGVGAAYSESKTNALLKSVRSVELGHVITQKNGILCRCGRKGCLETKVSTHAIAERVREKCNIPNVRAENINEWITKKNSDLDLVLKEACDELARTVVNIFTILEPNTIAVYGKIFLYPEVEKMFIALCHKYDSNIKENQIVISPLADKFSYIGSCAVAINEFFINKSCL